jgi:hypothetical protein
VFGAPIAARPDHWSPARDAGSAAEYVTMNIASHRRQGDEVEDILRAVERCHRVSWLRVPTSVR